VSDPYEQRLAFTVVGQPADTFMPFRLAGREAISELFRFEIDMVSENAQLAFDDFAGQDATLSITRLEQTRTIHGMVERVEQHGATPQGQFVYRAVLVPRLHRLAMSRQNQIHGTAAPVSVREVLVEELTANALKGAPASAVAGRLGTGDFELRLTRSYPQRDYIVQFDESDLAFISRLCEHHGIFYFFTHDGGRDVVVFGDSRVAFPTIGGGGSVAYRTVSGLANASEPAVFRFIGQRTMVPAQVCLRDYNYRLPSLNLEVDETVDPQGHGVVVDYGSHFRTPEEGRDLARVRAQELASRKLVFEGAGDSVHLAAGAVFDLTDHFRGDFNGGYLVTWVEHEATQAMPGIAEFAGPDHETAYRNRFECLPQAVEFRPARKTPKPRMPGLSNAVVDAAGAGERAEIDSSGRYKIRQQFDQRGETAGQASRYMRKAEPYGGAGTGMHFPLLMGTEVILACVNGDPDRPIIVGAMQNEQYPSVVNARSNTKNRIRTTSGTLFEIEDGPAANGGGGGASTGAALAPQRALEGAATVAPGTTAQPLAGQRAEAEILTTTGVSPAYARLNIPTGSRSYWRLGSTPADGSESGITPDVTLAGGPAGGSHGLLEYFAGEKTSLIEGGNFSRINGNRREVIGGLKQEYVIGSRRQRADSDVVVSKQQFGLIAQGISLQATTEQPADTASPPVAGSGQMLVTTASDLTESIGGNFKQTIAGTLTQKVGINKIAITDGLKTTTTWGATASFMMGASMTFTLGATLSVVLGATTLVYGAFRFDIGLGLEFKFRLGVFIDFNAAPRINVATTKVRAWMAKVEAGNAAVNVNALNAKMGNVNVAMESMNAEIQQLAAKVRSLDATV